MFRFKVDGEEIDLFEIFDQEVIGVIYDLMQSCVSGKMKMNDVIRALGISGKCGIIVNENYSILQSFITGFLVGCAEYNLTSRSKNEEEMLNCFLKDILTKLSEKTSNESDSGMEIVDFVEMNPNVLLTNMIVDHNKDILKFFFRMYVKAINKLNNDESFATQEEIRNLINTFKDIIILKPIINDLIKDLKENPKYFALSTFFMN